MALYRILFIILLCNNAFKAQSLVINELDCDSPGIDNLEFVELRSSEPNFALDGYVLVFFNGSGNGGNASYLALDLDGYTTDINGIFLIGSVTVSPFPQYIIPENTIQNGADGVAIYKADADDFVEGTVAYVDPSLVDVLLYDTNDPDALTLMDIFKAFNPNILQISEGSANNTSSIARNNDGTYTSGNPTPRRLNDGTGIPIVGIRAIFEKQSYSEGESILLTFTSEQSVTENININFSLLNGGFDNSDYTGNSQLVIAQGNTSTSTMINILNDGKNEGDEELILKLASLPTNYLALNNNVRIRIVDNDYKVAPFGTPTNPTYGTVKGTQNSDYYSAINGRSGNDLKTTLQGIIADPTIVRAQTYNDVIHILEEADQNPANSNQVWLVYLEKGRSKLDFQLGSNNLNTWNREHTWPRSRGGFYSIEADETFNGRDIFWSTGPDSLRHANSDAHAIRAEDGPENSIRGNQFYGQYRGPIGTKGSFRGDVARGIFYLAVRYNGLDVVSGYPEGMVGQFGDLDTLLAWHRQDLPDDFEMNRNNVVATWQYNRNPFIDIPDLVEYIWGNKQGQTWQNPSATNPNYLSTIGVYPNPNNGTFVLNGPSLYSKVSIKGIDGKSHMIEIVEENQTVQLNLIPGEYYIECKIDGKIAVLPFVVH